MVSLLQRWVWFRWLWPSALALAGQKNPPSRHIIYKSIKRMFFLKVWVMVCFDVMMGLHGNYEIWNRNGQKHVLFWAGCGWEGVWTHVNVLYVFSMICGIRCTSLPTTLSAGGPSIDQPSLQVMESRISMVNLQRFSKKPHLLLRLIFKQSRMNTRKLSCFGAAVGGIDRTWWKRTKVDTDERSSGSIWTRWPFLLTMRPSRYHLVI